MMAKLKFDQFLLLGVPRKLWVMEPLFILVFGSGETKGYGAVGIMRGEFYQAHLVYRLTQVMLPAFGKMQEWCILAHLLSNLGVLEIVLRKGHGILHRVEHFYLEGYQCKRGSIFGYPTGL